MRQYWLNSKMIDLSVVIVNFKTPKMVVDCVKSINSEGTGLKTEIIIVDNGSDDGSKETFEQLAKDTKNVVFIANRENRGYAKANNQGAKVARGEYLLLLNSDTLVKKGSLGAMVNFAKENPDSGVVAPKLLNADGSLQNSCFRFPTIKNAILEYFLGKKGLFDKYAPSGKEPVEVDAVVGAAFLITPQAKKKVGLLDERYWAYFEDIDYCRNVWKNGLKVYYLPGVEIVHYHGVSFRKATPDDANRWKRLIPSSKIYHGVVKHYLINSIIWVGQKWQKLIGKTS